jgi:hypothetical protein
LQMTSSPCVLMWSLIVSVFYFLKCTLSEIVS